MNQLGVFIKFEILTPSYRVFEYKFSGKEILEFIKLKQMYPTLALKTVLETQVQLANLHTHDVVNGAMQKLKDGVDTNLRFISNEDNLTIVFESRGLKNKIRNLNKDLREASLGDKYQYKAAITEELRKDPDVKEFINILVCTRSSLTLRYKDGQTKDSVDLLIPYDILKTHSDLICN